MKGKYKFLTVQQTTYLEIPRYVNKYSPMPWCYRWRRGPMTGMMRQVTDERHATRSFAAREADVSTTSTCRCECRDWVNDRLMARQAD